MAYLIKYIHQFVDYPLDYFVDLFVGVTQSVPPKYLWVPRGGKGAVQCFVLLLQKKKLVSAW